MIGGWDFVLGNQHYGDERQEGQYAMVDLRDALDDRLDIGNARCNANAVTVDQSEHQKRLVAERLKSFRAIVSERIGEGQDDLCSPNQNIGYAHRILRFGKQQQLIGNHHNPV